MSETGGSLLGHVEDGNDSALQALFFVVIALFLGMLLACEPDPSLERGCPTITSALRRCRHLHKASPGLDQNSLHSSSSSMTPAHNRLN